MAYSCEWLKYHIDEQDPATFPCEWAKENWNKSIEEITQPFPCQSLRDKWTGETYRTVLYTDGTFIINEKGSDQEANEQAHGNADYVYPPLDADHDYVFPTQADRYWKTEQGLIKSVNFGSPVQPISMRAWFTRCVELESFDSTNLDTSKCTDMYMLFKCESGADNTKLVSLDLSSLDTSKVTNMRQMFNRCTALTSINVGFDTSSVTTMQQMFGHCSSLTSIDLSSFGTTSVTDMQSMFGDCTNLQTIYVSNLFDVANVTTGVGMFGNCTSIVGGAGTTYVDTLAGKSVTYARIDNPPDAPGYFTEK